MSKTRSSRAATRRAQFLDRYGPWAVVTGASSGNGRAFAFQLAERGMNLVLVSRRRRLLEALAQELITAWGIEVRVLALDLGREPAGEDLATATVGLDVGLLVSSAGFGHAGPFIDAELANDIEMVNLNCRSLMEQSWHFGRRFVERGRGGLVLMSSLVGFQGVPLAANYAATKAYVQSLAEGLHLELRSHGVDVIASAPGPVHSGFASRARMQMGQAVDPDRVARVTLAALGRKSTVRPGFLSKFLEGALKPLTRPGRVRMMAKVMRGMAADA